MVLLATAHGRGVRLRKDRKYGSDSLALRRICKRHQPGGHMLVCSHDAFVGAYADYKT